MVFICLNGWSFKIKLIVVLGPKTHDKQEALIIRKLNAISLA